MVGETVEGIRKRLVEQVVELVNRTPSEFLLAYLPVLGEFAEHEDAKPPLRFVAESGVA